MASNMSERIRVLSAIAAYEDEERLEQWADEYELPEHIKTSFWDELLLSRYAKQKSVDKFNEFIKQLNKSNVVACNSLSSITYGLIIAFLFVCLITSSITDVETPCDFANNLKSFSKFPI